MVTDKTLKEITVGEIVTTDFRAAEIFKKAGIDFCCGGHKSLEQACREKNLNPAIIVSRLSQLEKAENEAYRFNEWELGFLCDYIMNIHHKYVTRALPELVFYTRKIASVHGENHPELTEVERLFTQVSQELPVHIRNEEDVLFPAIKEILRNKEFDANRSIIRTEINRMLGEHDFAGGAMDDINLLTSGYSLPPDACNTYRVTFQLLRQFEDDLHVHVHLENNILFPKAMKL